MPNNSYITSLIQYLKAEIALAEEQSQNGGSIEAKNEACVAYDYMNALLVQIEQEYELFVSEQYTYNCSSEGKGGDENDND